MAVVFDGQVSAEVIEKIKEEVETEISCQDLDPQEKAALLLQLGNLEGLLENHSEKQKAWNQAREIDPENSMIKICLGLAIEPCCEAG